MSIVDRILAGFVPAVVEATTGTDLVSNLLTGGGFVFLAAVMGGLALWNKNQSEGARSIAEGAGELIETTRKEIKEAYVALDAARKETRAAETIAATSRRELEQAQDLVDRERRKFQAWLRQQKFANDRHKEWDDEVVASFNALVDRLNQLAEQLRGLGVAEVRPFTVAIREAPPLATCPPDDLPQPKADHAT